MADEVTLESLAAGHERLARGQETLRRDVDELKRDVSVLKQDVSVLKQDVSALKQDVSVLKQDMSEVKKDILELKVQGSRNERDIAELRELALAQAARTDRLEQAMLAGFDELRRAVAGIATQQANMMNVLSAFIAEHMQWRTHEERITRLEHAVFGKPSS
jgi:chromosome segregation ATPase